MLLCSHVLAAEGFILSLTLSLLFMLTSQSQPYLLLNAIHSSLPLSVYDAATAARNAARSNCLPKTGDDKAKKTLLSSPFSPQLLSLCDYRTVTIGTASVNAIRQ